MPNVPYETVRYGRNEFVQHEAEAGAAITAGMLLERSGSTVQPHSTDAGEVIEFLVAYEDRGVGMELHPDQTHDKAQYESGDNVKYYAASGGGFTMWLAGGEVVSEGDNLVSNGDGQFRAAAGDGTESGGYAAVAAEDVDASDGNPALIDIDVSA